ncbi:MAG: bacillithiol biosynthesis cysteine-adding enzyme BshC [Pseudomonadota bacterium]
MRPQRIDDRAALVSVTPAYLRGQARSFFPLHFASKEDRLRAVREAAGRPPCASVLEGIRRQNARLAPSPARERNLELLGRGAVAVVTGQQVGLFGGPLFTVYKAATAIRAARLLSEESGHPAVPVFWLQTEDHDLPEIARFGVPDADGRPLELVLPHDPLSRRSIAHLRLPATVEELLAELGEVLGHLPFAHEHLAVLRAHYRPGASFGAAFVGLLAELFAEEGLVFVDPRDEAFGSVAVEVHRWALEEAGAIEERLRARAEALRAEGFAVAVALRERSPLSFFHPQGREGPRHRLVAQGDAFALAGAEGRWSRAELLRILGDDPLRFSTSALLRPLLQDRLLPTAAYVGGPGEIAYFAQLGPLYELFGRPMPLLFHRAQFRVLEGRVTRRLSRLGLREEDLERDDSELLARLGGSEFSSLEEELLSPLLAALERRAAEILAVDPSLERAIRRTRFSVQRAVSRFSSKVVRAQLQREGRVLEDLRYLRDALRPKGIPQERFFGLAYAAARFGQRDFLRAVLRQADPLDPASRALLEEEIAGGGR